MRSRAIKSVKDELIKKSREAMLAAVQVYNNPQITFKAETFIALAVISWTYLMHAYYRQEGVEYRYFKQRRKRREFDKTKYGAYKHWELERCINDKKSPLDKPTVENLLFLIGLRHEIEHQMTNNLDEHLSAKLQACAINFDYYIKTLFGDKYSVATELAISIQFSALTPEQEGLLRNNDNLVGNVRNFISEFESQLSDDDIKNSRYAYRVLYVPINANRKGQADQVVEFVKSGSELHGNIEQVLIKETEKNKYIPSQIVEIMKNKGYSSFNITAHTKLWQNHDAKNPAKGYGVKVANAWYWYENWIAFIEEQLKRNKT